MADLMAGPNVPLTKAFLWRGWRTLTVDWLLDPAHDLSNPHRQASLEEQLKEADFVAAAWTAAPSPGPVRYLASLQTADLLLAHSDPKSFQKGSQIWLGQISSA